ncbi:glycosyltransferase family 2 protein [Shimia sp. FJ5]|nr:glycosyltransferase [Shimia sp. FJ5]MDV4144528.1 glycosyltransferase [Shimia sp. FJ5]
MSPSPNRTPPSSTCVAICTCDRHAHLHKLLSHMPHSFEGQQVTIFVADNGNASAAKTLDPFRDRFDIHYLRVAQSGVSPARNAVLRAAFDAGYAFVACIDDDEWPTPQWLTSLSAPGLAGQADIVIGPSKADLQQNDPSWIIDGALLDRYGLLFGTHNILLSAAVMPPSETDWFKDEFAHSGGGDWEFITRMAKAGARLAYAPDALVHEHVPARRKTIRYFLSLGVREGTTFVKAARLQNKGRLRPVLLSLREMLRKIGFGLYHIALSPTARWHLVRAGMDFSAAAAILPALLGQSFAFYGRERTRS